MLNTNERKQTRGKNKNSIDIMLSCFINVYKIILIFESIIKALQTKLNNVENL
jgi:hypothetical protein